jgi:hypothetical protein
MILRAIDALFRRPVSRDPLLAPPSISLRLANVSPLKLALFVFFGRGLVAEQRHDKRTQWCLMLYV